MAVSRSTNTVYVFYTDQSGAAIGYVVSGTGGTWSNSLTLNNQYLGIYNPVITTDATGNPTIVYQDDNGYERLSAQKLVGGSWVRLGNQRFSHSHSYAPSITFSKTGTPYLFFQDDSYDTYFNFEGSVMTLGSNSVWNFLGNRGIFPVWNWSTNEIALDTANVNLYVAYADLLNGGRVSVAMRQLVTTGFAPVADAPQARLYPNPAASNLYLNVDERFVGRAEYQVWTTGGQLVTSRGIMNTQTPLGVDALPKGVYVLKIIYRGQVVQTMKFVH